MLLNQQGQQVPATAQNIMDSRIREVKDVDNHKCFDMFKIGARARFKGEMQKGWSTAQKEYSRMTRKPVGKRYAA